MALRAGAVAAVLLALASAAYAAEQREPHVLRTQHEQALRAAKEDPLTHFRNWVVSHAKEYVGNVEEYERRYQIWLSNLEYILEYNAAKTSHWLHLNSLADLTQEEFKHRLGYKHGMKLASNKLRSNSFKYAAVEEDKLPVEIDWRAQNAVSEVSNNKPQARVYPPLPSLPCVHQHRMRFALRLQCWYLVRRVELICQLQLNIW